MSPAQPFSPITDPTAPFRNAINALLGYGRDMLGRVQAAITHNTTANLPKRLARAPQSAAQKLTCTLDWVIALAATLAGSRTWLRTPSYAFPRFPGRYPALTAQLRAEIGLPPVPPVTEAQKQAAHRRYVQKVFATVPTAQIARRLARRLGIDAASDFWPRALLAITDPPAVWAKAAHAKPPPASFDARPQSISAPPDPPTDAPTRPP